MINSSFDVDSSSPLDHRDDSHSEMIGLESNSSSEDRQIGGVAPDRRLHQSASFASEAAVKEYPSNSIDLAAQLDVKTELDSLLTSLQLTIPHPPNLASPDESSSIASILATIVTTDTHQLLQDLKIAHERATTRQEAFYDSLQAIQAQVAARSDDSEHKLSQYHESIQSLSQTISTDRLRIAQMSVDLSTKLTDLHSLNAQITTMHAQIVEKSQTLQARITQIDRGFRELLQSIQTEKEQFYALTVESIEKTELIRSQLAEIFKQRTDDRQSISALKAELESVRQTIRQEAQQKLINFDLRERELISICNDLQALQKDRTVTMSKISTWLWILSVAVGVIFISLIRILMSLR